MTTATSATTAASAATTPTSSSASTSGGSSTNALTSLSSNFNSFLNLLLTQMKNQDPSSPMDTNSFTQELVQFSSVEQQITTNTSLTTLIQATQGTEVIQGTAVVGKTVELNSTQVPLQNGTGTVDFTTAQAEPVDIKVTDSKGLTVKEVSQTSTAGANSWTWDGTDSNGAQLADGAYTVAITGSTGGTSAAVPFTVRGTATGVVNNNGAVTLNVGALSTDFSKIVSVGN